MKIVDMLHTTASHSGLHGELHESSVAATPASVEGLLQSGALLATKTATAHTTGSPSATRVRLGGNSKSWSVC
jgi:hypothetical protein